MGHGIHSPAVYEFVSKVLYGKTEEIEIQAVLDVIRGLSRTDQTVGFTEYGAGSSKMCADRRKVRDIVKYAGTSKKYGKLLFRLSSFYKPKTIVEFGTSVGISTMYLAAGLKDYGLIFSVEGNKELAAIAKKELTSLAVHNTEIIVSTFEEAIRDLLPKIESPAIVFIDGNHVYDATISYFEYFLPKVRKGMIIIGDIYWSIGMEMAWKRIKEMSCVTIDLYYMGIVLIDEMLTPGHYMVRY